MALSNAKENETSTPSVFGFGTNYFHALGGTTEISLSLAQDESDKGQEEDVVHARILTDPPPWKDDDTTQLQQVACSATATIFLTTDGHVYQTGTLHGIVAPSPLRVQVAVPRKCVEISAGRHFCVARLEQGIGVVSWGAGHFGQLGLGNHISSLSTPQLIPSLLPQALGTNVRVQQVAAGAWHALALLDNGTCMAWGSNRKLQCGISPPAKQQRGPPTICTPQQVPFYGKLAQVTAGRQHSLGIEKETGRVYAWGASHFGQCGQYSRKQCIAPPRLVEALQKVVVVDIAAGNVHSLALTGGGRVFCWGSGMDGQLGLGGVVPLVRPKLISDLDFVAIQAGKEWKLQQQQHQEPQFRSFDEQELVQPPPPTAYTESPAASASHLLSSVPKITQIYATGTYSAAVSSSGHLYTWGYNDGGQLGVPRSCTELPLVEVTSTMMKQSSSGRLLQIRSFESRHNVLLPRRVDALGDYRVTGVAVGPCNMWCIGTKRLAEDDEEHVVVGQTLWEAQEERRRRGLFRLRKNLSTSSSASVSSASGKMSPTIMSIQAISKENVEQVVIPPDNVFAHKESTGLDEDEGSTTTFEAEQQSGIILPVQGEHQPLPTQMPPRIQEPDRLESGESLTMTSVEASDGNVSSPSIAGNKKTPLSSPTSSLGKAKSFSKFISRRSKSRKKAGRSRTLSEDDAVETQEQQLNGKQFSAASTSPTLASTAPLGFAGGKPQLFANLNTDRRKMGRSQSVPSRRSTTPPPGKDWDGGSMEPSQARLGSVARLMRARRNPKTPTSDKKNPEIREEPSAKKGRVRKALTSAFGGAK